MNSRVAQLELEFRRRGGMTAREVADALGTSQPTVSRLLSDFGTQRVLRMGRGKATRYAMRRCIRELGSAWPLYDIGADGHAKLVGRLCALEAGRWYLEQAQPWESLRGTEFRQGIFPALPWFLQDLRPQGFLGRCFARRYADTLGASPDPRRWSDDDVAAALLRFGEDVPGSFVLGDIMLASVQTRMIQSPDMTVGAIRPAEYPARAAAILGGQWPGSSAAGEQPKFTACVQDPAGTARHVIVKFSGGTGRPEDRRWADLLMAEHIANTVLSAHGIACAGTRVLEESGRFFLESARFDRSGANGRRGLVSLDALDAAFFGRIDTPWTAAAERLQADGWLSAEDSERLAVLWWFGTLIGNTDMHHGNVSLMLAPCRPLPLASAYDMVPMYYRPDVEGRFTNDPLIPAPPPPEALPLWSRAADMASQFWSRLAETESVTPAFRDVARENVRMVAAYRHRFQ